MTPTFQQITILHDSDERPTGSPARLQTALASAYPKIRYATPLLPHSLNAKEAFDWAAKHYISRIGRGSLIVGFGRGGLVACALQSAFPALNLSVVAINAPTEEDGLQAKFFDQYYSRMVLYSAEYPRVKSRCDWGSLSPMAYNVNWLTSGNSAYYPLAYLVGAFMRGKNMDKEVSMMFPTV